MNEKKRKLEFFNKKARFDYLISDSVEAGIVLSGLEIKAIRNGRLDLSTSYVKIINGEVFWIGGVINVEDGDRQKTRKLLLRKEQIEKFYGKISEQNFSLIPLKVYFKRGKAKMEVGIGRGMKKYEKRDKLRKRDVEREISQKIKDSLK